MSEGFTMFMAFREAWDERGNTAAVERSGGFTWWMRVIARHEKMFGACPVFQTDRGEEI